MEWFKKKNWKGIDYVAMIVWGDESMDDWRGESSWRKCGLLRVKTIVCIQSRFFFYVFFFSIFPHTAAHKLLQVSILLWQQDQDCGLAVKCKHQTTSTVTLLKACILCFMGGNTLYWLELP